MNKKIESEIVKILTEVYQPVFLDIENESDKHSGPKGRESHFKVLIVSDVFKALKRIDRQKHVYQSLKDVMPRIHALALRTLDLEQYQADQNNFDKSEINKTSESVEASKKFISPDCTHKSDKKNPKS